MPQSSLKIVFFQHGCAPIVQKFTRLILSLSRPSDLSDLRSCGAPLQNIHVLEFLLSVENSPTDEGLNGLERLLNDGLYDAVVLSHDVQNPDAISKLKQNIAKIKKSDSFKDLPVYIIMSSSEKAELSEEIKTFLSPLLFHVFSAAEPIETIYQKIKADYLSLPIYEEEAASPPVYRLPWPQ